MRQTCSLLRAFTYLFPVLGALFSHILAGLVPSFHLDGCILLRSPLYIVQRGGYLCRLFFFFFVSPGSLSTFIYLPCFVPQEDDFYKLHLCSLAIWLRLKFAQWGVGGEYEREAARLGCLFPWLFLVCSLHPCSTQLSLFGFSTVLAV